MTLAVGRPHKSRRGLRVPHRLGPRLETKFEVTLEEAENLSAWLMTHLAPDPHAPDPKDPVIEVATLYFDSPERLRYEGRSPVKLPKYRVRRYGHHPTYFLEEKFRLDDRVWKRRIALEESELGAMIHGAEPLKGDREWFRRRFRTLDLVPTLMVEYDRRAFVAACGGRVTLDQRARARRVPVPLAGFITGDRGSTITDRCVLELKGPMESSPLMDEFRNLIMRPQRGYSKYSAGLERVGLEGAPFQRGEAAVEAEVEGDLPLALEIWGEVARSARDPDLTLRAYLRLTRLCLETERFELAEAYSARGLEQFVRNRVLMLRHGLAALRLGNPEVALRRFRTVVTVHPSDQHGRLQSCQCLLALGRYEEADRGFLRLIDEEPDFLAARRGYARLAEKQNSHHEALRRWATVLREDAEDFEGLGGLARAHEQLGNAEASLAQYHRLIDRHPERPAGYRGAARLTQLARGAQAAMALWQEANAKFPADVLFHLGLVDCLSEVGRLDDAKSTVETACGLFPQDYRVLRLRARLAREEGDTQLAGAMWKSALERLRELVAIAPGHPHRLLHIGECLMELGRYEEADHAFVSLIDERPDFLPARRGYARLAEKQNAPREALRRWAGVLRYNAEDLQGLSGLARAHEQLGDVEASLAQYHRLIELHPERPAGYRGAARLTQLARGAQAAIALWQTANAKFPANVPFCLGLIDCLVEVGRLDDAKSRVEKACALFPRDHRPLVSRARLALANHRYNDARVQWEAIRKDFDTTVGALLDYAAHIRECGGKSCDTLVSTLERAVALEPGNLAARVLLAECLVDLQRLENARDILEEVLRDAPNLKRPSVMLARVEAALGNQARSEDMLRELARSTEPRERLSALFTLATLRLRRADPDGTDQALRDMRGALEGQPARERFHLRLREFVHRYKANPRALAEMRRLVAPQGEESPHSTLHSLLDASTRYPEYVPIFLQIAQRFHESGCYEKYTSVRGEAGEMDPHIPHRIVQFWDSPDVPWDVRKAMETWRREYSDWDYLVFDDAKTVRFLEEHYGPAVVDAYRACYHPAMKSDFFRHTCLFVLGGVYVDADEVCHQRIDIPASSKLVLRFENRASIGEFLPGFYASCPRSTMLEGLVDEMVDRVRGRKDHDHWFTVGPGMFTKHVVKHLARIGILEDGPRSDEVLILMQTTYQRHASTPAFAYKSTDLNWLKAQHGV